MVRAQDAQAASEYASDTPLYPPRTRQATYVTLLCAGPDPASSIEHRKRRPVKLFVSRPLCSTQPRSSCCPCKLSRAHLRDLLFEFSALHEPVLGMSTCDGAPCPCDAYLPRCISACRRCYPPRRAASHDRVRSNLCVGTSMRRAAGAVADEERGDLLQSARAPPSLLSSSRSDRHPWNLRALSVSVLFPDCSASLLFTQHTHMGLFLCPVQGEFRRDAWVDCCCVSLTFSMRLRSHRRR